MAVYSPHLSLSCQAEGQLNREGRRGGWLNWEGRRERRLQPARAAGLCPDLKLRSDVGPAG